MKPIFSATETPWVTVVEAIFVTCLAKFMSAVIGSLPWPPQFTPIRDSRPVGMGGPSADCGP